MSALGVLLVVWTAQGTPVASRSALTPPAPSTSGADIVGGRQLEPDGAGGYRWPGTGFTAFIAPDGAVRFEDHRPLPSQVTVPVRAVAQAIKESTGRPDPRGPLGDGGGSGGLLGALGRNALRMVTNPTLVVNDEELRHDSHHAAKMTFIEGTATLRQRMREAYDRKQAGTVDGQARRRIQSIAADASLSLSQRHQLVFDLWDECDEAQAAGAAIRASIENEAARQFPAGDRRAFTAAELKRLNRGHEQQPFDPYRDPPAPAEPTAPTP
jgi:hypothetical protein